MLPAGYAHRYPDGIRFGTNGRSINGSEPIEAIPFYFHPLTLEHTQPEVTGHECNGTYKTFAAEHCPYCQRKPPHPADRCSAPSCGICKY